MANIFAAYAQPYRSVADFRAERQREQMGGLQIEALQRANASADMGMQQKLQAQQAAQQEAQRVASERNALARLAQESGGDEEVFTRLLERSGLPSFMELAAKKRKEAAELAKTQGETVAPGVKTAQAQADTDAKNAATAKAKREESLTQMMRIADPASMIDAINRDETLPMQARAALARTVPQDPVALNEWKVRMFLMATDAAKTLPKVETRNAGGTMPTLSTDPITGKTTVVSSVPITQSEDNKASNARMAADAAAARSVQIRGQNMADARARETASAVMSKPFEVTGPDGKPVLVQQDKQGNIQPVQGFGPKSGSAKPLTDAQAKALLFGTRAQESDKLIAGLEGQYNPLAIGAKQAAGRIPLVGGAAEAAGNVMLSEAGQKAEQAQRDFINAILRRESGAVISEQEFANAAKQYFPQAGDSKAVRAQKAKNRDLAVRGILAEVPQGQRDSITPQGATPGVVNWEDLK